MKYIRFTYIDSITGLSVLEAHAKNGPKYPEVADLVFLFSRSSDFPTNTPMMYGVCDADADTTTPGVLEVLSFEDSMVEHKQELRRRISALYTQKLNDLFEYDFGEKFGQYEDGIIEESGVRQLQCRPHDREQWVATHSAAMAYIIAGMPDEPMRPFKTVDNFKIPMTATEAHTCLMQLQATKGLLLDNMWALKESVEQATSHEALQAIDLNTGW